LLIAVWDGQRANGRGGTGDVVQAAVAARIPVIVVDPSSLHAEMLTHRADREFDPPFATDLPRRPLPRNLQGLTDDILLPSRTARRHPGFNEMLAEPARRRFRRP